MGRPKLDIDPNIVERLAMRFCSKSEIAAVIGCDGKTIANRFSEEYDKGRENGKSVLRELQWKAASAGNIAMLIFLGKQYLGQSDKQVIDHGGESLAVIERIVAKRQTTLPSGANGNGNGDTHGGNGSAPGAG